jgi:signal transduction histidine kinase/CheY-like chemotaxis protein
MTAAAVLPFPVAVDEVDRDERGRVTAIRLVFANAECEPLFADVSVGEPLRFGEVVDRDLFDFLPAPMAQASFDLGARIVGTGGSESGAWTFPVAGHGRRLEFTQVFVPPDRLVTYFSDVTALDTAVAERERALEDLRLALEGSPTGFGIFLPSTDPDGATVFTASMVNAAARALIPEIVEGRPVPARTADGGLLLDLLTQAWATGLPMTAVEDMMRLGETVTVSYNVGVVGDGRVVANMRDITELTVLERLAEVAARESESKRQLMHRALDSIPEPITMFDVVRDPTGTIVDFRVRFQNAAGQERDAVDGISPVGRALREILPPVMSVDVGNALRTVAEDGAPRRSPLTVVHADGETRHYDAIVTRVDDDVVLGVVLDQTELRRVAEQLGRARDEAVASAEARSELLTTAAHELRTPLTTVIAAADLLLDTPLDVGQESLVRQQREASRLLLALVNDTLDLSQLDAGRIVLEAVGFELADVVRQIDLMIGDSARTKGIELDWVIDEQVPPSLVGDPVRLQQVLLNLLTNAVKFTSEGGIEVRVCLEPTGADDDAGAELRFDVTDTGRGMRPTEIEQIFEPFQQGAASTRRRYGGSGLGLAITQRLVQQMGGRLWVTSERGAGSTFSFTTSLAVPDVDALPPAAPVAPRRRGERADRVLLAEDNDVNRIFVAALLGKLHVDVHTVTNGLEAVQAVGAHRYDLVLMDVRMPLLDGIEATRRIRAREAGTDHRCRIVALTASPTPDITRAALEAGMDGVLGKPVSLEELADVVDGVESGAR